MDLVLGLPAEPTELVRDMERVRRVGTVGQKQRNNNKEDISLNALGYNFSWSKLHFFWKVC